MEVMAGGPMEVETTDGREKEKGNEWEVTPDRERQTAFV